MAVFDGDRTNDQYFGTPEADRIYGRGGQDQLRGGAGNDYLSGGDGPDSLYGDQGDDRIFGDDGDDVVRGGRGADTIFGGAGVDVLFGDRDDDLLDASDTGTLAGRRDRALVSVMLYSFARVSAVIAMRKQDYFRQESRGWLRLHEKGGKRHDVPAHHRAAEALDDYLELAGLDEAKAPLFQSVDPAGRRLTGRALSRRLVLAMIKRRAAAADLPPSTCCHTFRAMGITAYLSNGGTLDHAQQIAGHASSKTTKLYDRTADTISVDEIERIVI